MPNLAFTDVETTGLNANDDQLLEIAVVVTDEDLNILDQGGFHAIVKYPAHEVAKLRPWASPYVQDMHEKTGLWAKLSGPDAEPLHTIDLHLREYLALFGKAGQMPVAGNSVRLDMNFMDAHLPLTAAFLNYQMRDVTSIAGAVGHWLDLPRIEKKSDHTAMVDVRESIRELRYYRDAVKDAASSERGRIAWQLRARADKEAPNAKAALKFMAGVVESGRELPDHMVTDS